VVAGHVQKRDVDAAHDVLEVVPGQVSTREDEVGFEFQKLVSVEAFVDLVCDRKDSRQVMPGPLGAV
jgi:hypothetical protein